MCLLTKFANKLKFCNFVFNKSKTGCVRRNSKHCRTKLSKYFSTNFMNTTNFAPFLFLWFVFTFLFVNFYLLCKFFFVYFDNVFPLSLSLFVLFINRDRKHERYSDKFNRLRCYIILCWIWQYCLRFNNGLDLILKQLINDKWIGNYIRFAFFLPLKVISCLYQ